MIFTNYNSTSLAATPFVYLFPVGEDRQRVAASDFKIRSWRLVDQTIPVPFPIGSLELSDPSYLPAVDSLDFAGQTFGRIRKFPQMVALHDGTVAGFTPGPAGVIGSRLVGRSVWNTRWLLIIPGSALKADAEEGLTQLIEGNLVKGVRDGDGITDIRIRFDAYSYTGN